MTRDITNISVEQIRRLHIKGLSLADIARQAGATVPVVRRVVGKFNRTIQRQRQEEAARTIASRGVPGPDQVAAWHAETGQCEVTNWRVLKRTGPGPDRDCPGACGRAGAALPASLIHEPMTVAPPQSRGQLSIHGMPS